MAHRGVKREPVIPPALRDVYHLISKADLAEAAVYLGAAMTGCCDDWDAGAARLLAEINALREARGAAKVSRDELGDFS